MALNVISPVKSDPSLLMSYDTELRELSIGQLNFSLEAARKLQFFLNKVLPQRLSDEEEDELDRKAQCYRRETAKLAGIDRPFALMK